MTTKMKQKKRKKTSCNCRGRFWEQWTDPCR